MKRNFNKYLLLAIGIALLFHGSAIFFTLEKSYDALIHLFFAEHYANNWSEPWSYKWYTGFTTMSYPPLVHQILALLSFIGGLKFALFTFSFVVITSFVTGVYRFSYIITKNKNYAGFAALFSVFSSVFIETLHLFGQLPTLTGIALLMHSLPEIYYWVKFHKTRYIISSWLLISLMVCSHHVTPIFGMVFFVFPVIGLSIMDNAKDLVGDYKSIRIKIFLNTLFKSIKQIVAFGLGSLVLIIFCILPYWINTKNNPITQIPIPHGSRDNFLEVLSSGLVFFIIPYGITLCLLPYILYRVFSKRLLFFGLSFLMLFILGTGGTTPIPKMILGENAFSILTLDRFTFWAAIISFPFIGEFFYRLAKSDYKKHIIKKYGKIYYTFCCVISGLIIVFFVVFTTNLGRFNPSQPRAIKMLSIVNFLNQDMHYKWRYMTLGFGDQMAWLSSQTKAISVDGNYHSARQLPELTTKAVERLENSKFRGIEGIGSLQQFLANSEKFNLKYIFSNDKFYDPILYFSGWERLSTLENGIIVWEKQNIAPLALILPKVNIPKYQKIIWAFVPVLSLIISLIWFTFYKFKYKDVIIVTNNKIKSKSFSIPLVIWNYILLLFLLFGIYKFYMHNSAQISPDNVVKAYYDAMDFKEFKTAHSFIDPNLSKDLDQFMLEISVTDGLLSSYAKLEEITTETISKSKDTSIVITNTKWITPLEIITKEEKFTTVINNEKWYIIQDSLDKYTPSNQFFNTNITEFYNQGRRKITTQQTHHEDILPQPVVRFHEAKLIKKENSYFIIGSIQNIDYFPASINLKGVLYDEQNKELASFSTKFESKHKLNPMESSVFKIEFEETAWLESEKDLKGFNPNELHPKSFKTEPVNFVLHASSTITTKDLYQSVQINNIETKENVINGVLFNSGNKEVTIPQLLISHYESNQLVWVDHKFIKESIRPHRTHQFEYATKDYSCIEVLLDSTETCYVNGIQNSEATYDRMHKFDIDKQKDHLIYINDIHSVKLELNNFIGKN